MKHVSTNTTLRGCPWTLPTLLRSRARANFCDETSIPLYPCKWYFTCFSAVRLPFSSLNCSRFKQTLHGLWNKNLAILFFFRHNREYQQVQAFTFLHRAEAKKPFPVPFFLRQTYAHFPTSPVRHHLTFYRECFLRKFQLQSEHADPRRTWNWKQTSCRLLLPVSLLQMSPIKSNKSETKLTLQLHKLEFTKTCSQVPPVLPSPRSPLGI